MQLFITTTNVPSVVLSSERFIDAQMLIGYFYGSFLLP